MIYDVFESVKDGKTNPQEKLIQDISKFNKQLTLWGSKNVINGWLKYKHDSEIQANNTNNLLLLENILNDMRKDIGTKKLKKYDILSFFLRNDAIDTLK